MGRISNGPVTTCVAARPVASGSKISARCCYGSAGCRARRSARRPWTRHSRSPSRPAGPMLAETEPAEPALPEILSGPLREVPVDSHRQVELSNWDREPEPEPAPAPAAVEAAPVPIPVPVTSNVIFDQEPALRIDEESEAVAVTPPRKPDTAMRIAVGLGAAACVLL